MGTRPGRQTCLVVDRQRSSPIRVTTSPREAPAFPCRSLPSGAPSVPRVFFCKSMPTASTEIEILARKIEREILRKLAAVGQNAVAQVLGCSETKVSRMKEAQGNAEHSEIREIALMLAACGLKTVGKEYKCCDPAYLDAVFTLARKHLETVENSDGLVWEPE